LVSGSNRDAGRAFADADADAAAVVCFDAAAVVGFDVVVGDGDDSGAGAIWAARAPELVARTSSIQGRHMTTG